MATTTYGSPYAQSADLVSTWPATSLTVADRIDDVAMKGNGINAQTGTTYTTVLTDAGKTISTSNASSVTVTIPTNASVAYETGTIIRFLNIGAGALTIAASGGVTINNNTGTTAQYGVISIQKTATDTWYATPFSSGSAKATVTGTTGSPTVTTVGTKTCYKWTGSGSVTIGTGGTCQLLVVGGGGGGGGTGGGYAGGGGGGVRYGGFEISSGTYTVTVGAGASGNTFGGTSSIGTVLVSGGGDRGIYQYGGGVFGVNAYGGGGSPGGFAIDTTTGNPTQAYGGGAGGTVTGSNRWDGLSNSITGSAVTYAAGGTSGGAGTANTGNGGGSTNNGGSGVVILLIG